MTRRSKSPVLKTPKLASSRAVRRNISLPQKLDLVAEEVAARFGFSSVSDYFQARLRKDAGLDITA